MSEEPVFQVRLPDGTAWIAEDSRPDDPRASWIYARSTADMFARQLGGTVVEVTRHQQEKLLDQEIAAALAEPRTPSKTKVPKTPKMRTRPFSREARRSIRTAILENVPLSYAARSAIDTAKETAVDAEHNVAIRTLRAALPTTLWISYDAKHAQGYVQEAEPIWITADPQGEDPSQWQQIARDEIARVLVEDA